MGSNSKVLQIITTMVTHFTHAWIGFFQSSFLFQHSLYQKCMATMAEQWSILTSSRNACILETSCSEYVHEGNNNEYNLRHNIRSIGHLRVHVEGIWAPAGYSCSTAQWENAEYGTLKRIKIHAAERIILTAIILEIMIYPAQLKCIATMHDVHCTKDEDCKSEKETYLYCNKTNNANKCAFNDKVYIGRVYENWDCPGPEFSAVPWGNPVAPEMAVSGLDCMRLCLFTTTCFGISVNQQSCYLKNDACFKRQNFVQSPNTITGVLRIMREDFHCGCNYPFERKRADGSTVHWFPVCPAGLILVENTAAGGSKQIVVENTVDTRVLRRNCGHFHPVPV